MQPPITKQQIRDAAPVGNKDDYPRIQTAERAEVTWATSTPGRWREIAQEPKPIAYSKCRNRDTQTDLLMSPKKGTRYQFPSFWANDQRRQDIDGTSDDFLQLVKRNKTTLRMTFLIWTPPYAK